MKKVSFVIAVVTILTIAQTGVAVARGGDQGDRGSQRHSEAGASAGRTRHERSAESVDNRQAYQQARIREGRERHTLNRAQDRASDRIFRAKNNDHDRGRHYGWGKGRHHGYKPHSGWQQHGYKRHHGWQRHGHNGHSHQYFEKRVVYAPSASSSLAVDLQIQDFSVGLSRSRQF